MSFSESARPFISIFDLEVRDVVNSLLPSKGMIRFSYARKTCCQFRELLPIGQTSTQLS